MNIIVLASACRCGGALTIYKQFISHISKYVKGNKYYLFIDPHMDHPDLVNVEYIYDSNHSYMHRMYMNKKGYMKEIRKRNIIPDVIFSLQNTGCLTRTKQVIYYHQPLPFYPHKWNPLKKAERIMFLYKYIYPIFVKHTLNKKTEIVVQIPFIKRNFVNYFNHDASKVHVAFPDIEQIDLDKIKRHDYGSDCFNLIFPASHHPYKEHLTIVKAVEIIKNIDRDLAERIRVHFTIRGQDNKDLFDYINRNNISRYFIFHGNIPHSNLLSYYKGATGLLFPSSIETLGLPLLEGCTFGLPIIAADLDYAHEVTEGYDGIEFIPTRKYEEWAKKIIQICKTTPRYKPLNFKNSEWDKIFNLILSNNITSK